MTKYNTTLEKILQEQNSSLINQINELKEENELLKEDVKCISSAMGDWEIMNDELDKLKDQLELQGNYNDMLVKELNDKDKRIEDLETLLLDLYCSIDLKDKAPNTRKEIHHLL